MEPWIGIFIIILMVPGLALLIAVVISAVIHLKRPKNTAEKPINLSIAPLTRDVDA